MNTDSAFMLISVCAVWMIRKVVSVAPQEIGVRAVNRKFKKSELTEVMVEMTNMQRLGAGTFSGGNFLSQIEYQYKKGDYLAIMLRSTNKEIIIRKP